MNEYMVYFYDMTASDPYCTVECTVVEGKTEEEAVKKFHEETNHECRVRSVDLREYRNRRQK
jgi:hypothetical protein